MAQPLADNLAIFFTKQKLVLLYDAAVVLIGIYPTEMKTYVHSCSDKKKGAIKSCKQQKPV